MLPFTKRPGRDESGDQDVVTKDDLVVPAATASASKEVSRASARAKFPSLNDEEMTTLMAAKSLGDAARPSVRPAAGAPPPSRSAPASPASSPGGAPSSRSAKFASQDEDEDGRTVVRGAPKIVKRAAGSKGSAKMGMPTSPTTISPAAVIKATLESARAGMKPRTGGGDHLMAGPPQDLLEDIADRHSAERHPADVGAEHTAILKSPSVAPPGMIQGVKALSTQMLQPQSLPQGSLPPGSARPMSVPPPPNSHPSSQSGGYPSSQSGGYASQSGGYPSSQSGGYASQSGGYPHMNGPVPSGSVSVPGVSMPAHFMVPQPPYSDARMDPPGTAVTARSKAAGRSGTSWAMALAAFGLFVGVGAVAVMNGNADGVMETGASFVDPSRAPGTKAAAAAQAAAAQASAPAAAPTGVPVATEAPATVGVPPVAIPATPPAAGATAAPAVATAPAVTTPPTATAVAAAAPPAVVAAAPKPAAPAAAAPQQRPAAAAAAPASRPVRQAPVAAADEPAAKPAKPARGGKGGGEVDDETKKALDELQKAQLERSF